MKYLKEDGSLDIKRINQLPIEEYMDVVGDLTEEQYKEYRSINDTNIFPPNMRLFQNK